METNQYECENFMQVAHKVAELTNTYLDYQTWSKYCDVVQKDGLTKFDYTAFDSCRNEFDVSIFLGYEHHSHHYFVSVDFKECPVPDFSSYEYKNEEKKLELNEKYEVLADEKFHQMTKTLIKSLFKAIGTVETRKIHFIISNNMVFFNYNGMQYKYYPSQCKIFKKSGRKYQRINWNDFAEENNPDGQKQNRGRSPPFTSDIRRLTINVLK